MWFSGHDFPVTARQIDRLLSNQSCSLASFTNDTFYSAWGRLQCILTQSDALPIHTRPYLSFIGTAGHLKEFVVIETSGLGLERWLRAQFYEGLSSIPRTQMVEERTNSHRISSDLYTLAVAHILTFPHTTHEIS